MPAFDLKNLQEALSSESDVLFAYLFGSYACGEQTPLSDIDVAVYPARALTLDERLGIIQRLGKKTKHDNLDVAFLDRINNLDLLETITDRGLVLTDRNKDAREEFEVQAHHRYLDFEHRRKKLWNEGQ